MAGLLRTQLYPGEDQYFKNNPDVTGMAADDNKVIINPYSSLSEQEKAAVYENEAARIQMREQGVPNVSLTKEQEATLAGTTYKDAPDEDRKATILARILSGDKSGGIPTLEQSEAVKKLKANKNPSNIVDKARIKYGFLKDKPLKVIVNPQSDKGYAEVWFEDDPGGDYKRPADIPLNEFGIEIYKPDEFSEDDLAGEVLHADPIARKTADEIASTLNESQLKELSIESIDYQYSLELGLSKERALQNAVDGLIRGYVVGQWPKEAIERMNLNEQQKTMLQKLKDYAITGKTDEQLMQDGFNASFDTSGRE